MIWILYKAILILLTVILLNFIQGTIVYLVWKLVAKFIERKGYVEINYWIWKIVLLSFLSPVGLIIIFWMRNKGLYGFDFWYTNQIMIAALIIVTLWAVGSVRKLMTYIKRAYRFHRMLQIGKESESEILKKSKRICKELRIKRKIDILTMEDIEVPIAYGVFCPKIFLPESKYTKEELEIILYHELVHHKHFDLFWKKLFVVINSIYWFHPAMKDLLRQLDQWGEACCDRTAGFYMESVKKYFRVIIEIATDETECDAYCMGLCESSELLVIRMQRMQAYLKKKPLKRTISVCLILLIFVISSVTVIASSVGFVNGYNLVVDKTMKNDVGEIHDLKVQRKEKRKVFFLHNNVTKMKETIPAEGKTISFSHKLKKGKRLETRKKYLKAGSKLELSVSIVSKENSDSNKVAIGIIDSDEIAKYVNEASDLWHCFKIKKFGYYRVFIENYGEKDIELLGLYYNVGK